MQFLFLVISSLLLLATPAEEKKDSTARKDTVPVLMSQKNGSKVGFVNHGRQYYWWHDAHSQGSREHLMNNGYVLEWSIGPQYDNASKRFEEGLAGVEINGKIGYIDEKNRFILPPVFARHKFPKGYRNGLTIVYSNGKFGFMDKRGEIVIDTRFDDVHPFEDNMIAYVKMGSKYGAIDLKGDTLISCRFTTPESMTIGKNRHLWKRADSLVQSRLKQGYYDKELKQIREAEKWADALIADDKFRGEKPSGVEIADTSGRFGLKNGQKWLLKGTYDSMKQVHDGIFIVEKKGKFGACDSWGRNVLDCDFASVVYQPEVELFIVSDETGRFGIYDHKGAMILPPCLDNIKDFIEGQAECSIGTTVGFIDRHGQAVNAEFHDKVLNMSMSDTDIESRMNTLRQLIAFKPTYADAHNNLAACYVATEKFKVGIPMLRLAHRLDPENEEIKKNLDDAKSYRKQKARSGSSSDVTQSELQYQYDDAISNIRDIKDSWSDHVGTQGEVTNRHNLDSAKNTIKKIKKTASDKGFSLRTDSLEDWNP